MMDLLLEQLGDGSFDIALDSNRLPIIDDTLQSAVLASIFSEQGAWWADPDFGSKLHELQRAKAISAEKERIAQSIRRSLEWLLAGGLAREINVDAIVGNRGELQISVDIDGIKYKAMAG